ncbi:hypothetical protein [Comamonas thiooxydans]|uniref:hypothetical protein n=1 Tax=Comamonas thiooxydans TaxID=363952 RepID=UPI000B40EED2|nr:hypothetical protein [Comamonas thiooxydans]
MPIIGNFTFTSCDDNGNSGLVPDFIKGADPAHQVAHDLLDHFPGNLPGVEGELMAIGTVVLMSLENGVANPQNYGSNVAELVLDPLVWAITNNRKISAIPTRRLPDEYSWADEIMQDGSQKAYAVVANELAHRTPFCAIPYTPDELSIIVLSWLRKGYRKALKRYSEVNHYTVAHSLYKKVDKFSERIIRSGMLYDGASIKFVVSVRKMEVNAYLDGRNLADFC